MISVGSFACCGMSWTEQESTGGEMREEKGFSFSDLGHMSWEQHTQPLLHRADACAGSRHPGTHS